MRITPVPKFFAEPEQIGGQVILEGADASHIARTLRMRPGDTLTVCDGRGTDYLCTLTRSDAQCCVADILESRPSPAEPPVDVRLYVGFPKAEKAEHIVQKATELGVSSVIFFDCRYCVARPADFEKRAVRLRRIAREAAMQSGRGRLPEIRGLLPYADALREAASCDAALFLYEAGGSPVRQLLEGRSIRSCAAVTGPEGGFSPEEAAAAEAAGLRTATLGPRILRCETAPLCAASVILYETGCMA